MAQVQALLGAGDAHVHQAPLLGQVAFLDAHLMRQDAVFAADDEHIAELQPLGPVQAHQPHLVAAVVLVVARQQGQLRGQVADALAARAAAKPVGQFVQVGPAPRERSLVLALGAQVGQQARAFGQQAHQFGGRQLRGAGAKFAQDVGEPTQAVGGAWRQALERALRFGGAGHGHAGGMGQLGQPGQRRGAHFAPG